MCKSWRRRFVHHVILIIQFYSVYYIYIFCFFFIYISFEQLANTDGTMPHGTLGKVRGTSDMLAKLARTAPYYKRNRPHICSFWVKGACKRGEECPYRHEKPTDPDDPLADQNIKDRYFGINDPVAEKLIKRLQDGAGVEEEQGKTSGAAQGS